MSRKRPALSTDVPSEVPVTVTRAVATGSPVLALVTRPVSVPVCDSAGHAATARTSAVEPDASSRADTLA